MQTPNEGLLARVARIDCAIQIFLRRHDLTECQPPQVMPFLVEMGIFSSDNKRGRPLRDLLRELDDKDMLYLMPGLVVERKRRIRRWHFTRS